MTRGAPLGELVDVLFQRPYERYVPGDRTRVPQRLAEQLIAQRIAVAGKPPAAPGTDKMERGRATKAP